MHSRHLLAPCYFHRLLPSSSPFAKTPTLLEESAIAGLCLRCPNYPLSTSCHHLSLLHKVLWRLQSTRELFDSSWGRTIGGATTLWREMNNKHLSSKMLTLPLGMPPSHLSFWYVGLALGRGKQEWMEQFKSCSECSEPSGSWADSLGPVWL